VSVVRVVETTLPNEHGTFRCLAYTTDRGAEHLALVLGNLSVGDPAPLVRLHSECLTGDVLGSRRCDCGPQLHTALRTIAAAGRGAVVYLRGHEGRGIGLVEKLRAYRLQDAGLDTVDANLELGHPVDTRDFTDAVGILHDLGVSSVRLLSNNPRKREALESRGIAVNEVVPVWIEPNEHNRRYLATKRDRLGHALPFAAPE
jgi:3,4-dihydroxy 2-butanone 4-phosphate synthase/GTP cyclohydrolase II